MFGSGPSCEVRADLTYELQEGVIGDAWQGGWIALPAQFHEQAVQADDLQSM